MLIFIKLSCAHACCKLHILYTPTESKNGIKRVYEEDPILDRLLHKKIKPSEENDEERQTSFSVSNSVPLSNTQPYINGKQKYRKTCLIYSHWKKKL